jgi:Reverse transcriptase (RNA-dependent DNA polymerase)
MNTIKGLFRYTRLPYGIRPAAGIFQSVMDNILKGLSNVFCYIDDILIGYSTIQGLKEKLILVLDKLMAFNIKVNWPKCKFFVEKVVYLGHEISVDGIAPSRDGIE